ncbi:conserved hypothetical protein [Nitrosopumilaceae archaeon]|nr:hypothetical protein [Nitrosopumilus sp.]CAI9830792.1 conserved hypothetical protein [Nitrosopumilaceae archaeon]MDA7944486.1 hypothetical protein [Nitrosopumilus sp.]MDA7954238.1 hypothetical protein [Nitrosopumilus sp.]MDA7973166.1 hypothetical protein [Nitrosopumilus sp.]
MLVGQCPICGRNGVVLVNHRVVEAHHPDGIPEIAICDECRIKHDRYSNYLRDTCGIDIDRTRQ